MDGMINPSIPEVVLPTQQQSSETINSVAEVMKAAVDNQPSMIPAAAPSAAPKLSAADVAAAIAAIPTPAGAPTTQAPQTAADVDKIEPEWVQAAEQIMKQTAGSPYAEEEAIEDLQIDYLKKRYNRIIEKKPNV